MAEYNMEAFVRRETGKGHRMDLLRRGLIPAVVYGKTVGSLPVEVLAKDFREVLQGGRNTIINLSVSGNGGPYKVMIRDMQFDPVKRSVIHADFQQISLSQRVHATVPVQITGSPAGGLARPALRNLEVSCLPTGIPGQIAVDVTGMRPGESVTVSGLEAPRGVEFLNDPDVTVVTVLAENVGAEEVPAAERPPEEDAGRNE